MVSTAVRFASLINEYFIQNGPPRRIEIPHAAQLATIQEITVRGILLKNQTIIWNSKTARRRVSVAKHGGRYELLDDNSITFCVGVRSAQLHVPCRVPDGAAWVSVLNQAIGQRVSVSGFLRCFFDKAGFKETDDARIFEIHPVRSIEIGGELRIVELNTPISTVHSWTVELNDLDERRRVQYWKGKDTLAFSNVELGEPEYVYATGRVRELKLNLSTDRPGWFILQSPAVARQVKVTCLQGTQAARQIRDLHTAEISVTGLRSIDLV